MRLFDRGMQGNGNLHTELERGRQEAGFCLVEQLFDVCSQQPYALNVNDLMFVVEANQKRPGSDAKEVEQRMPAEETCAARTMYLYLFTQEK